MEKIGFNELAAWTSGVWTGKVKKGEITGISTDSRTIMPGELFIPIKGDNFDGHVFIKDVLRRGASGFLTSQPPHPDIADMGGILVPCTMKAYQDIARNYLKQFRIPVTAVTGSNGKTTVKDMISQLLEGRYKTVKTEKNFNNEIGVPKTVFNVDSSTEALVVELAMRGLGQIRQLAEIVKPDIALITNIGEAHYELLGSIEAIAEAKSEILEHLNPSGFAILNADDPWFFKFAEKSPARVVSFGAKHNADVLLLKSDDLGLKGYNLILSVDKKIHSFYLPLLGTHNIYNALAAVAAARCLRLSLKEIEERMRNLKPSDKRMEAVQTQSGWTVLNDSYNASPASTIKALDILGNLPCTGRRIAVLGDMLELGVIARQSHRNIGEYAYGKRINALIVKGDLGAEIAEGALISGMDKKNVLLINDNKDISQYLKKFLHKGDVVLIKGSRRMAMEEIVEEITDTGIQKENLKTNDTEINNSLINNTSQNIFSETLI